MAHPTTTNGHRATTAWEGTMTNKAHTTTTFNISDLRVLANTAKRLVDGYLEGSECKARAKALHTYLEDCLEDAVQAHNAKVEAERANARARARAEAAAEPPLMSYEEFAAKARPQEIETRIEAITLPLNNWTGRSATVTFKDMVGGQGFTFEMYGYDFEVQPAPCDDTDVECLVLFNMGNVDPDEPVLRMHRMYPEQKGSEWHAESMDVHRSHKDPRVLAAQMVGNLY